MDILITKDGFQNLIDIVITNLIHTYGVVNIDDINTCNDDGYSRKDLIIL